jgi:tRNA A-37 threonylcarbamoyl transferase component Bud32
MALPLPPPERDGDESARVRMSEYVPDTTARDLPQLPQTWQDDEVEQHDATQAGVPDFSGMARHMAQDRTAVDHRDRPRTADPAAAEHIVDESGRPDAPHEEEVTDRVTMPGVRSAGTSASVRGRRMPLPGAPPTPTPPAVPKPVAIAPSRPVDPGRLVGGRYRLMERIGQGGMGKVYKAIHEQLGKVFALKIIGEQLAQTDEARNLFYREARLASSLSHPNVTSVVDFGEDADLGMFMVMELVEGEPLARLLHREGRLGVRLACEIILQVAEALHYIHDSDVVHCDIKTENIILTEVHGAKRRQLQAKLLDFGLAKSMSSGRATASLSGTPHYVAPERIRGEPPSPSSDIYGVGILLYELLTGKVPWDGHVAQILAGHLEQQPTPPSKLIDGGLDPAVENLILRALAKTPAARHKDMAAFLYELRTVMDMLGYGRRKKGGGGRRVLVERSKNERDDLVRIAFETCRLPLALLAPTGIILVANAALAKFVMGVSVDVEGLTVQSTPLASCWTTFEADLMRAQSGQAVRRVLEMDVGPGETRRLLMWLDRGPTGEHIVLGVQPLDL